MTNVQRLPYLDNLRVALITLVIAHHVGQAYGPTGGSWLIMEDAKAPILAPFFMVNRSFFMSLFFMIAGYFTVMSFRSKGAQAFLKERALRLGLPTLLFALGAIPVHLFLLTPPEGETPSVFPLDVSHLWFLEHLLIFSAVYVLWQEVRGERHAAAASPAKPPGYLTVLAAALVLAAITGVVRIWFPIDRWSHLLGFISVAFADVPRDLGLFIVGVIAYDRQWLQRFSTRDGYVWLGIGVVLAVYWYVDRLAGWRLTSEPSAAMNGLRLVWEMLLCFGMCIGLTVLFRERFNSQGKLGRALAQSQYAAYIFHVPFVWLFQFLVLGLDLTPLTKFALVTLATVPTTFLFSYWVRKPLRL